MEEIHSFRFDAMNTEFEIRVPKLCLTFDQAKTLSVDVIQRIEYIEDRLSRFVPSSDITNINQMNEGEYHILDPITYDCLDKAMQANQITDGYFSVQAGRFDESQEIEHGVYFLHEKDPAISCQKKGRSFDLGGIGKGFALDSLSDIFEYWDLKDYYISAGNSTILVSNETNPSWNLMISHQHNQCVNLINTSISGSGDCLNTGHIKIPINLIKLDEAIVKTWVKCASATFSDALSTACSIMSASQIQKMVNSSPFNITVLQQINNKIITFKKHYND